MDTNTHTKYGALTKCGALLACKKLLRPNRPPKPITVGEKHLEAMAKVWKRQREHEKEEALQRSKKLRLEMEERSVLDQNQQPAIIQSVPSAGKYPLDNDHDDDDDDELRYELCSLEREIFYRDMVDSDDEHYGGADGEGNGDGLCIDYLGYPYYDDYDDEDDDDDIAADYVCVANATCNNDVIEILDDDDDDAVIAKETQLNAEIIDLCTPPRVKSDDVAEKEATPVSSQQIKLKGKLNFDEI
ncbi:unnamed protein product [Ceratitis capitata]|uniref:(Mediterranean fruit fly) hypothetical protein n=1 Tax=Ceratitis capitata TaxID=7213 RepID=A0A811VBT3_CERCA|nr:unnamed protein product [Ceratitis capitata]